MERMASKDQYQKGTSDHEESSNFTRAIQYHLKYLSIAKQDRNRVEEGHVYSDLGQEYYSHGDFRKALEYHQLHLNISKEVGEKEGEGRAYGNLGIACISLSQFRKAIEYHELQHSIFKELEDRSGQMRACANLGVAYKCLGDYKTAIEYNQIQLEIAKEVGNRSVEGKAYANIGQAYHAIGELMSAMKYHQLNLGITKELGDRVAEANAYSNLGNVCTSLGYFKTAMEYHQQHLRVANETGNKADKGRAYANIGIVYECMGDSNEAKTNHQRHLDIAEELGNRHEVISAYCNLGIANRSLGNFQKAIEHHQQQLTIAKDVEDKPGEGKAYSNLGICYHNLGDFSKAMEYHNCQLKIAKVLSDSAGEGRAYSNLGVTLTSRGDFKSALEYLQLGLNIAKRNGNRRSEGGAYANLGDAYRSIGDLSKAEECYKCSVRIFDSIRDHLQKNEDWKISLRNHYKHPYTALWNVQLLQYKTGEALLTAEWGRAQALMDLMESNYGMKLKQPGSDEQMETFEEILNYISSEILFLALSPNALNFWVLHASKECQFAKKIILNEEYLDESARNTFEDLKNAAYAKIGVKKSVKCPPQDPLKMFYDLVVSPVADLIRGDEVTIVPDGPLFLAPFAAFMDQNSNYLSDTLRIRLIPTLSTLKILAECPQQSHSTTGALLVGDPWLGNVRIKGEPPKQLPCAKKEVEMIGQLLNIMPLTDKIATKAEVLKRLSSVALVHIAAHGKEATGEILLSPNPTQSKKPKEKDYVLTMEDVKSAKLHARLVVLSCCHSSQGEVKAEGVVGIARAFLAAGARSVLASLWKINDAATLKFMEIFYKQLVQEKQSAGKSLNQAMKQMRESENFNDVGLWAPFVLIGDDVTFDFDQTRTSEVQSPENESTTS